MAFFKCGGKPEEEKTVTAGTSAKTVTPTSGKTMKKVTVNPTPSETKTVTPSTSQQVITPSSGKLLSKVTVSGDANLVPDNIKSGVNIFGKVGTFDNSEGLYVWKKCKNDTDHTFINYVVSDNESKYLDGVVYTDGYYYEKVGSGASLPINYEFTGSSIFNVDVEYDSNNKPRFIWDLRLLTSGALTIKSIETPIVDTFLVGGGGGGGRGAFYYKSGGIGRFSGKGGGGGYTKTALNANISKGTYQAIIGAGGAGGNWSDTATATDGGTTSIGEYSIDGGKSGNNGSDGGSGGGANGELFDKTVGGTGQGTTTRAFGESNGELFAGGGGGGSWNATDYGSAAGDGGSDGSNGKPNTYRGASDVPPTGGKGGAGGGGNGGSIQDSIYDGVSATVNTGGGGGGAGAYSSSGVNGGSGAAGIIILRGRYE